MMPWPAGAGWLLTLLACSEKIWSRNAALHVLHRTEDVAERTTFSEYAKTNDVADRIPTMLPLLPCGYGVRPFPR